MRLREVNYFKDSHSKQVNVFRGRWVMTHMTGRRSPGGRKKSKEAPQRKWHLTWTVKNGLDSDRQRHNPAKQRSRMRN